MVRREEDTEAIKLIHSDLQEIKLQLVQLKEILEAWNNAKGFVRTIKLIGDIVKWGVPLVAIISTVWYFLTTRRF